MGPLSHIQRLLKIELEIRRGSVRLGYHHGDRRRGSTSRAISSPLTCDLQDRASSSALPQGAEDHRKCTWSMGWLLEE